MVKKLLTNKHLPLIAALLALILTLPNLGGGLMIDDYYNRLVVLQPESYPLELAHPLDTYSFFGMGEEWIKEAIDLGLTPWWSNPEIKGRFWRPLTSMTQYVDYHLWDDHRWVIHLHSMLWNFLMIFLVALVLRRFMG